ncbi:72 kDa inositol polyphosphate 5-phosphatase [Trichinella pseudospiralis]|uniref:72 kDa inositol polyphosphate 5-phosphatase n=1 Tax=Trichinella pseudospiralis TaxID=6337 RepID=A0A0V0YBZ6_TRIPS|nr:72 kDa inositol polyphosphate 5-phosphatase [Trichinella pseudospiralis]
MHKAELHNATDGWNRTNGIDEAVRTSVNTAAAKCDRQTAGDEPPSQEMERRPQRAGKSLARKTAERILAAARENGRSDSTEPACSTSTSSSTQLTPTDDTPHNVRRPLATEEPSPRHNTLVAVNRQSWDADLNEHCPTERTSILRHSLTSPNLQLPKIYLSDVRENKRASIVTATLLGPDELDRILPGRKLNLFVATFNMAGKNVTENELKDWLMPTAMEHAADLYAVGIQEASANCSSKEFRMWEKSLQKCLSTCKQVLVRSVWMGVQHLALFIRRELVWFISDGPDARPRIAECNRILHFLRQNMVGCSNENVFDGSDYVLWFGDMNFRLNLDPALLDTLQSAPPAPKDVPQLIKRDQLLSAMKQGQLLSKFHECPIEFLPSYKFIIGTSDYSIQFRLPAYTVLYFNFVMKFSLSFSHFQDRILFKKKESDNNFMECLNYNTAYNICSSDHKPVFAHFKVHVQPEIQDYGRQQTLETSQGHISTLLDHVNLVCHGDG